MVVSTLEKVLDGGDDPISETCGECPNQAQGLCAGCIMSAAEDLIDPELDVVDFMARLPLKPQS